MPANTKISLEEEINRLTAKIWNKHESKAASERILIGISGIPGSGEEVHTFDAEQFCSLVKRLPEPVSESSPTIYAASFDHVVKDPVADSIPIAPSSRIVILEGNYISLDREPWKSAAALMGERWFVTISRDVARERLAKRHVASGIVLDAAAAYRRIDSTDNLNADDILNFRLSVDEEIAGDS